MKHIILFFLKPLSFLPALAMMYVIYGFSAQDGNVSGNLSYQVSYKIVEIGNEILDKGLDETQIADYADQIGYPVRKLAHMTEYFLLAVAVSFPFYVYGLRGFPLMLVAGFICVAFAAGDEYHQSFVAGRGPSVKDVGIDSIGAFFGIMTVQIICWVFLAPARSARRQEEFAYRKRARREEAQRRREYIRRQEAARRRRSRY
ncbi:MAG: VanZ family protein [Schaedlerella sp.]|uniref:VanZ family protein n=1 Tax=Schaedlerella sp. TaxID=2676057 RepID=UPI002623B7C8|nr:VanZ family protein [uncultured Schaedlerella sp.]